MGKIAVVGGGISGLAVAQMLRQDHQVVVFEKEETSGGLIRCKRINGNLFHMCGGHVFNSKKKHILDWFWKFFDRDMEFVKADRNSVVFMEDGVEIPYPIENHAYLFPENIRQGFIEDLVKIANQKGTDPDNFEDFLIGRFGETLYKAYFNPYNKKIWRRNLSKVPLTWLEGKLPMPTIQEMLYNNIYHVKEKSFVHSTFYYEKENGSQLIADRLSENLNMRYGKNVEKIDYKNNVWYVDCEEFDKVIFCGNIMDLPRILTIDLKGYQREIDQLEYHGTTSVFCEIDNNPYSWIYLPNPDYEAHRIICTGNFSPTNNVEGLMTATVEFTDAMPLDDIKMNLQRVPLHPKYITHCYNPCTYPIQDTNTREMIVALKNELMSKHFYFTGRFADWEYYNMDVAIDAAMKTVELIDKN